MGLLLRKGLVLDTARDHEELARPQHDLAIAQADGEPSLQDEEEVRRHSHAHHQCRYTNDQATDEVDAPAPAVPLPVASTQCSVELERPQPHEQHTGKDVNKRQDGVARKHVIQRRELRCCEIGCGSRWVVAIDQDQHKIGRPPHYHGNANQRQQDDRTPQRASHATSRVHMLQSTAKTFVTSPSLVRSTHTYHATVTTFPPVIICRSAGARAKTAFGVPAAAQISAYWSRSASIYVFSGAGWPSGATPPIAKPVCARTNAASALAIGSPASSPRRSSFTRFAPLATTRIGRSVRAPRKTSDLTIWPTEQPTASAASWAVRVLAGSSTTRHGKPSAINAS